jgi:hypothetical protein
LLFFCFDSRQRQRAQKQKNKRMQHNRFVIPLFCLGCLLSCVFVCVVCGFFIVFFCASASEDTKNKTTHSNQTLVSPSRRSPER